MSSAVQLPTKADSRILNMMILTRMRSEWWLWLAFTTVPDPYRAERTITTRAVDRLMCDEIARSMKEEP